MSEDIRTKLANTDETRTILLLDKEYHKLVPKYEKQVLAELDWLTLSNKEFTVCFFLSNPLICPGTYALQLASATPYMGIKAIDSCLDYLRENMPQDEDFGIVESAMPLFSLTEKIVRKLNEEYSPLLGYQDYCKALAWHYSRNDFLEHMLRIRDAGMALTNQSYKLVAQEQKSVDSLAAATAILQSGIISCVREGTMKATENAFVKLADTIYGPAYSKN